MTSIAIIGEAWGTEEEKEGKPFVGTTGYILNNMLAQVGIRREDCFLTNVFNLRPKPSNDVINLCGPRSEAIPNTPALLKGKFVRKEYAGEIERLKKELHDRVPNVAIALGATAAWALLGTTGIRNIRGAADWSPLGFKVVPTYHPTAVARDWTLRPVVLADLNKAKRESAYPDLRRPERHIWIAPTLADLAQFEKEHIENAERLSVDIETKGDQITCIGFAPNPHVAIVIPFFTEDAAKRNNYWPSLAEELAAFKFVERWCQYPTIFQNGLYDIQFLWRRYGIKVPNAIHDTMLLHHAMQPEMQKGLGFLGSVYTDEASWKFMRKTDTVKRED